MTCHPSAPPELLRADAPGHLRHVAPLFLHGVCLPLISSSESQRWSTSHRTASVSSHGALLPHAHDPERHQNEDLCRKGWFEDSSVAPSSCSQTKSGNSWVQWTVGMMTHEGDALRKREAVARHSRIKAKNAKAQNTTLFLSIPLPFCSNRHLSGPPRSKPHR